MDFDIKCRSGKNVNAAIHINLLLHDLFEVIAWWPKSQIYWHRPEFDLPHTDGILMSFPFVRETCDIFQFHLELSRRIVSGFDTDFWHLRTNLGWPYYNVELDAVAPDANCITRHGKCRLTLERCACMVRQSWGCVRFPEFVTIFSWTQRNWEFRRNRKWSMNRQFQC